MWKVLLAEDEVFVRESIREIIDWESMGFNVIGEAGNGREALQIIQSEEPHLVLTDIIMPEMDGIELLKKTREAGISCKFVMLTCMSEFEYIRQAMEYGASNYILKLSMNVKDLRETLGKIGAELARDEKNALNRRGGSSEGTSSFYGTGAALHTAKPQGFGQPPAYAEDEEKITHPEINRIIAYIHEHYDEDLSVKFLSQHVIMGENYVSALFKKKTGHTLIHYLHQVRIDKAIWYLVNTRLSISEVGHKVGFANDNYFIKIFKRHTSTTPSLYRKEHG